MPFYDIAGRDEYFGLLDGKRPISGDNWVVIIQHFPHVYLEDGNEKLCIVAWKWSIPCSVDGKEVKRLR